MKKHGGDIYRNEIDLDFSVNINPCSVPKKVKDALTKAVENADVYPDIFCEELKKKLGEKLGIEDGKIICGNGASELMMATVRALNTKNAIVTVPSFSGYEYSLDAAGADISFYEMKEENGYRLDEEFLEMIDKETDIIFLANPNNPTGALSDQVLMERIISKCREENAVVVLDECFIELSDNPKQSFIGRINEFDNLIIIRAFTKSFAIPGVRLGYLVSSNVSHLNRIHNALPEWNVSVFAQAAGVAACDEEEYLFYARDLIKKERNYLKIELEKLGVKVFDSNANFLLIKMTGDGNNAKGGRNNNCRKQKIDLYEELIKSGILIRDCENYRGLAKGYYRIAVKRHEENERLIEMIKSCL